MSRSNIDFTSNIYIRNPATYSQNKDIPEKDDDFVVQIMDADALRTLTDRAADKDIDIKISEAQWQLLVIKPCEHCATGEMTHGLVRKDGQVVLECRCSVENCPHSDKCGKSDVTYDENGEDDIFAELSRLGMDIGNIFANPEGEQASSDIEDVPFTPDLKIAAELMKDKNEYFEITADDAVTRVIGAPLSDVIILNGAAGAGKTYTAVERLEFVLGKSESRNILMLCCTDNTATEIKTRIEQKIQSGELSDNASKTALGTLDVLIMKYLADKGVPVAKLREMSFKQRAVMFKEKFDKSDFAEFDYCIIDEIHELEDEHAQIVLDILRSLSCGCLLLEDKYQAIFDLDENGGEVMSVAEFYRSLRELFPNGAKKYNLLGNKRQSENLDKMTEFLRSQVLDDKGANISDICKKQLAQLPQTLVDTDFEVIALKGETAILCMKNGDAEYISWLLNKNKVRHTLVRENVVGTSLGRYLADILWDWNEDTISRDMFIKRFVMRCGGDERKAEAFFSAIINYSDKQQRTDVLECTTLAEKICCGGELPAIVMNAREEMLTISTIKRAKGREFDKVYLLGYDFSGAQPKDGQEDRLFYLAETRPKSELEVLRHSAKLTFRKNANNRWIRTIRDAYKERSKCVGFGTGDSEDLDYYSFVEGNMGDAVQRQAYISQNVKCGDEVYLRVCGGVYEIIHNGFVIGKMSQSYSDNLLGEFGGRRFVETLPEKISELFVTNIITFVSLGESENNALDKVPPQFRKKRFWLGVEISGFGTI